MENGQFPHGHLVPLILLPGGSTIHLEITGVADIGCTYKHFVSVPEYPL